MNKDYYKTLNINRESSQDDIKKAFRKLSKQHHPDKGGDEATFKEMSEAYDTLSNPEKRRQYDRGGQNPFGSGNPFANSGPDMEDLFGQFFGGQRNQRRVKKGRNLNIPLRVELEDVYFSRTKKLKYKKSVKCASCGGVGGESWRCTPCNGTGHIEKVAGNAFFRQVQRHQCGTCNGEGKIITKPCNYCNGTGGKTEERTIDFRVPPDLQSGQTFLYKGGGSEIHAGQTGDLLIEVVVGKHENFVVMGSDLIYQPKIAILDMILGCKLKIPHFDGSINVDIPERSELGNSFNVSKKGMKTPRGNKGNLVIKPKLVMPKNLNVDERRMLESLSTGDNFKI
jgi:molecular chaperone DnaJ